MLFRNLTFYRFPTTLDFTSIEDHLRECALKPVGPLELATRGFVSPYGRGDDRMTMRVDGRIGFTLGGEDKILPPAVVNDLLAKKLAAFEKAEGRIPGGRTRKRIKEDLLHELLPQAMVKPSRANAYLDLALGLLVVDTAGRRVSESVAAELRHAMGSFPALPVNAEVNPRGVLTGWLAGEPLPAGMALGDEFDLREGMSDGAVVKCRGLDPHGDEVRGHLEAGMQVSRLQLLFGDHAQFVLGEDLVLRKFRLLDGALDRLENVEREDLQAELHARLALTAGTVAMVFDALARALKFSEVAA